MTMKIVFTNLIIKKKFYEEVLKVYLLWALFMIKLIYQINIERKYIMKDDKYFFELLRNIELEEIKFIIENNGKIIGKSL